MEGKKNYPNLWLKLRMPYYPNPYQRKLLVAYSEKNGEARTTTIEQIVRKYFASLPEHEINHLLWLYENDPDGEIRRKEKDKYIEKTE